MEEQTQNTEHPPETQNNYLTQDNYLNSIKDPEEFKTDNYLDSLFNPAQFKILYPKDQIEEEALNEEKKAYEQNTYSEIVLGLESDMKNIGMDVTYSAKIIIRDVAMNLLFIQRIKKHIICRDLMRDKEIIKPTGTISKQDYYECPRKRTSTTYGHQYIPDGEINPVIEKLLPQFEKQIDKGLKELGLLPVQQIERQKLTIIKKLKQKYSEMDKEYSVKAELRSNKRSKSVGTQPYPLNIE